MPGAYRFEIPDDVAELLCGLHPEIKRRLRSGLDRIRSDPAAGKPLVGELPGLSSLRVGQFRIVYRPPVRRVISIVAAGPRRSIYAETLRLIEKGGG